MGSLIYIPADPRVAWPKQSFLGESSITLFQLKSRLVINC